MSAVRHIRAAGPADLPAMSALIQRTVEVSNARDYAPDQIAETVASFESDRLQARLQGREAFVCVEDDTIAGVVSFARSTGRLHSLFVYPGRQQGGIGRDLVDYVEDHAARAGVADIVLSSSITAVGFYEKLGYERLDLEPHPHGSTYLMRKHLPVADFDEAAASSDGAALKVS